MNSTAALGVAVSICVMMVGLIAHPAHKSQGQCKVLALADFTSTLLNTSLELYIKNNKGGHLGRGFPELEIPVEQECDRVSVGLRFMVAALEMVRKQQWGLNPNAVELKDKLHETKNKISSLVACISVTVCTKTTATPAPPPTPTTYAFDRKQWGRTVLKNSEKFLTWLTKWLKHRCE